MSDPASASALLSSARLRMTSNHGSIALNPDALTLSAKCVANMGQDVSRDAIPLVSAQVQVRRNSENVGVEKSACFDAIP